MFRKAIPSKPMDPAPIHFRLIGEGATPPIHPLASSLSFFSLRVLGRILSGADVTITFPQTSQLGPRPYKSQDLQYCSLLLTMSIKELAESTSQ